MYSFIVVQLIHCMYLHVTALVRALVRVRVLSSMMPAGGRKRRTTFLGRRDHHSAPKSRQLHHQPACRRGTRSRPVTGTASPAQPPLLPGPGGTCETPRPPPGLSHAPPTARRPAGPLVRASAPPSVHPAIRPHAAATAHTPSAPASATPRAASSPGRRPVAPRRGAGPAITSGRTTTRAPPRPPRPPGSRPR